MSTIAKLSIEQYDQMIDAGVFAARPGRPRPRVELIEGELREMSPIGFPHETAVERLSNWSYDNTDRKKVQVRIQMSLALVNSESCPEPDVVWVAKRKYRARPTSDDVLLLIEVAESSLEYDLGEKLELYAKAGITDYWVVDLVEHSVIVHRRPQRGKFREVKTYTAGDEVRPLAQPKATLVVKSLFLPE